MAMNIDTNTMEKLIEEFGVTAKEFGLKGGGIDIRPGAMRLAENERLRLKLDTGDGEGS